MLCRTARGLHWHKRSVVQPEQSPQASFDGGGAARVVRRDSDAGGVVEKAWPTVGTLISKLEGGGRAALAPAPAVPAAVAAGDPARRAGS